jgi:hypothetical protein
MSVEALDVAEAEAGTRRRLRVPTLTRSDADFDLRNTWQIAVGAILLPLGIIIILLAWYGAAHARVVQQQIPYMVSGGFVGLGLMIGGGLMFWAHWLYRIYDQANLHHQELIDAINRIAGAGSTNGAGAAGGSAAVAESSRRGERLVATGSGTNYHRADCSVVRGRRGVRTVSAAEARDMQPCRICEPVLHG